MFVTLEGIEGAGKSTLLRGLAAKFEGQGNKTVATREPGGSELGTHIRATLLKTDGMVTPEAELFLFLADRAQHVAELVRPALEAGRVVLCDRYIDSTLVYQGCGRGFAIDQLRSMCEMATGGLWPDVTFLIDLDVRTGLARAATRHERDDTARSEGRFEAEPDAFHEQVRHGFLELARAEPERIVVLDGSCPADVLLESAWNALAARGMTA